MATIGTTALTLADLAKRMDSNDKIARIIELLAQKNEILDDMRWVEGNLPTGHRTTVRTGLPQATWRKLNYGVQPTKSNTAQITDTCGMLETYAEIDKALADLNGNTAEFRLSEDQAFLEGMSQQMAGTLFYGNTDTSPERFLGLAHRYSTRNAATASSANVIHGGGSGSDNTSIWLVVWGELTVHGIIPKGSKAGLQHHDLGEQTLQDADGGKYQGYRTHYKWDAGLTVRDWRHAVRIANIDVSDLERRLPRRYHQADDPGHAPRAQPHRRHAGVLLQPRHPPVARHPGAGQGQRPAQARDGRGQAQDRLPRHPHQDLRPDPVDRSNGAIVNQRVNQRAEPARESSSEPAG